MTPSDRKIWRAADNNGVDTAQGGAMDEWRGKVS